MAEPGATPSHQLFAGFNAFFSSTWQKTRVEQVSLKVFHLWRIDSDLVLTAANLVCNGLHGFFDCLLIA